MYPLSISYKLRIICLAPNTNADRTNAWHTNSGFIRCRSMERLSIIKKLKNQKELLVVR